MNTRPLAELAADPENPRVMPEEAAAGLRASVDEFGDIAGIVLNARTGQLVAGHQRVAALAGAGAIAWVQTDEASGYIEHPETGDRFAVRIVNWSEEQQRLANLAANNPAIAGEFTPAALAQLRELEHGELFAAARLSILEEQLAARFADGWHSDIDPVTQDGENLDGIQATIKVTCPQEAKGILLEAVQRAVNEAGIDGVTVA